MSSSENIQVVARCRPFSQKEKDGGYSNCIEIDEKNNSVSITTNDGSKKQFTFDASFGEQSIQVDVYQKTASRIVDQVLKGYNGTVFCYGQTGTGKTYTMQGLNQPPDQRGIIPGVFNQVMDFINCNKSKTFLIRISYLEIYNEQIRDLLSDSQNKRGGLDLKEHPERGVFVKDLSATVVHSVDEMQVLMDKGNAQRTVAATAMNATSSRSHSIFTLHIESQEGEHIIAAKLNLVDLAGSERSDKTGATGDRLKEGVQINLSLSALGNCISALVDGKAHVPYRDSKLTRLLQDSLGGNAKTLMVATLSPADYNSEETLSTLNYANRAKRIKNKPKINEDPKDSMIKSLQDEIRLLKDQLSALDNEQSKEKNAGIKNLQLDIEEKQSLSPVDPKLKADIQALKNEVLSFKSNVQGVMAAIHIKNLAAESNAIPPPLPPNANLEAELIAKQNELSADGKIYQEAEKANKELVLKQMSLSEEIKKAAEVKEQLKQQAGLLFNQNQVKLEDMKSQDLYYNPFIQIDSKASSETLYVKRSDTATYVFASDRVTLLYYMAHGSKNSPAVLRRGGSQGTAVWNITVKRNEFLLTDPTDTFLPLAVRQRGLSSLAPACLLEMQAVKEIFQLQPVERNGVKIKGFKWKGGYDSSIEFYSQSKFQKTAYYTGYPGRDVITLTKPVYFMQDLIVASALGIDEWERQIVRNYNST